MSHGFNIDFGFLMYSGAFEDYGCHEYKNKQYKNQYLIPQQKEKKS